MLAMSEMREVLPPTSKITRKVWFFSLRPSKRVCLSFADVPKDHLLTFSAGYTGKVVIGMDVAASEFQENGKYDLNFKYAKTEGSQWVNPDELADIYKGFISEFPVVSIEDAYDQDDWAAWTKYVINSCFYFMIMWCGPNFVG